MNKKSIETSAPPRGKAVTEAKSSASASAARTDWGFKGATVAKLVMIGYLLDEDSQSSANLNSIFNLVVNAGPGHHGRILAYLRDLTENLANDPQADPRAYAKKVLRGNDDPA